MEKSVFVLTLHLNCYHGASIARSIMVRMFWIDTAKSSNICTIVDTLKFSYHLDEFLQRALKKKAREG
jgi:hypothetical protein